MVSIFGTIKILIHVLVHVHVSPRSSYLLFFVLTNRWTELIAFLLEHVLSKCDIVRSCFFSRCLISSTKFNRVSMAAPFDCTQSCRAMCCFKCIIIFFPDSTLKELEGKGLVYIIIILSSFWDAAYHMIGMTITPTCLHSM